MGGIDLDRGADFSPRMRHILRPRGLKSAPLLLKHFREEPKPDDQANGINNDCDVDAVPVRILALFVALLYFIHRPSLFRKFRPKLQYLSLFQARESAVSTLTCNTGAYSNCSGLIKTLRNTVIIGASQIRSECFANRSGFALNLAR